jgi:hypothetical protein
VNRGHRLHRSPCHGMFSVLELLDLRLVTGRTGLGSGDLTLATSEAEVCSAPWKVSQVTSMLAVTLLWQSMHVEGEVDCCAFRKVEDTRMQSKSNSSLALICLFLS